MSQLRYSFSYEYEYIIKEISPPLYSCFCLDKNTTEHVAFLSQEKPHAVENGTFIPLSFFSGRKYHFDEIFSLHALEVV